MGSSTIKLQKPPHQPLLSSLIVRLPAADHEPGELRRDPHSSHSRPDRNSGDSAQRHKPRAGSTSPVRRKYSDRRYNSDLNRSRSREVGGSRKSGRFRGSSPPHSRERDGVRPFGRGRTGPDRGPLSFRGEGINRNNPNVRPREGDWYCQDPLCGNLNFARRDLCNNCKRSRPTLGGSPRRGFLGPPPLPDHLPRRFPGPPPLDHSPGRPINGFRSPPRALLRDGPREFDLGLLPPLRHEDLRAADHHLRRDRLLFLDDHYRGRARFDRSTSPIDWARRDRGRESFFGERKPFEKRPLSPLPLLPPPLPPPHLHSDRGRWGRDFRERSRSPIRGGPPLKDYRRDAFMDRGRDHDRRGMGRDRIGGGAY